MLSLTSRSLLVLTILLSVLAVVAVVFLVYLAAGAPHAGGRRRLRYVAPTVVLALLGPALAVAATGFAVNDDYGFYTSWADLTGAGPGDVAISTNGLLSAGQGALQVSTVHAPASGIENKILVWTPPGYDPHAARPYPVLMFIPGQPNSPQTTFQHFGFGAVASRLVLDHQVPPFVAVFPTLMVAPPRDTECTNLVGGVQAKTWLGTDVPSYMTQHYRVRSTGKNWSIAGWSTGGFCAAKLLTTYPTRFGSAIALGAYFSPIQDRSTGNLFGGRLHDLHTNSPMWLYLHHAGLEGDRLLVVTGKHDRESWKPTSQMLNASAGDPAVSQLVFPKGGHNFKNYRHFLAQVLIWGAQAWTT